MALTQDVLNGRRRMESVRWSMTPVTHRGPGRRAPPAGFLSCALVAGLLLVAAVVGPLAPAGSLAQTLPLVAYAVMLGLVRRALVHAYPHPTYGKCNIVTHLRATGVAGLTAVLAMSTSPMGGWLVPAVAGVVLALDGVDGWLARRAGRCSAFGARFDMETDAALALLLSALVWQGEIAGAWVLWLGLARYGFMLAGRVWPWLRAPLPQRLRRKTGCVLQVAALVLALVPGMPPAIAMTGLALAAFVLLWSFGADMVLLARMRHCPASPVHDKSGTARQVTDRAV